MKDVDLALVRIADIRSQLLATSRLLAISPGFNAMMALLALAVALLQSFYAPLLEPHAFIACWTLVFVVSSILVAIDTLSRARRLHGVMAHLLFRAALQRIVPFLAAAALVTSIFVRFAIDTVWLLPGLWLILLALQGFSLLNTLPPSVIWVAGWYFVCGVLVLGFAAQTRELSPWMMGFPLGVGQLFVALIFSRTEGKTS